MNKFLKWNHFRGKIEKVQSKKWILDIDDQGLYYLVKFNHSIITISYRYLQSITYYVFGNTKISWGINSGKNESSLISGTW